jgi:hypothetical protein
METKCTCERPDDNTCDYCEQQSSIQILEEAAAKFYREYPSNPLDKPEWHYNRDVDCFKKRKAFINGAKYMAEKMYSEEDMIEFGEWMKILPLTVSGFVIKDTNIVIKTTKELLKYWFENFNKK